MTRWEKFCHWWGWHKYGEWSKAGQATGYTLFGNESEFMIQIRTCQICGVIDRRNI